MQNDQTSQLFQEREALLQREDVVLQLGEAVGLRRLDLFEVFERLDANQEGFTIGSTKGGSSF